MIPSTGPFTAQVMDHFLHPRNAGALSPLSGEGTSGSVKMGKYIRIQVLLEDNRIVKAAFATYGCVPAIASSSCLTEWATGRTVEEAMGLEPDALEAALGGLPRGRRDCPRLAIEALRAALQDAAARASMVEEASA